MSSSDHASVARSPLHCLSRRLGPVKDESGSAVVEFIGLAMMLLIPVVYLLVGAAGLQGASYAAVGAADQAAKVYAVSAADSSTGTPEARSEAAVARALGDFGIDPGQAQISMDCPSGSCDEEGDIVQVTVAVRVSVPLVPQLGGWEPTLATVRSTSAQVVSL